MKFVIDKFDNILRVYQGSFTIDFPSRKSCEDYFKKLDNSFTSYSINLNLSDK